MGTMLASTSYSTFLHDPRKENDDSGYAGWEAVQDWRKRRAGIVATSLATYFQPAVTG
ncbi:hypothetical protein CA13_56490 [Planctomycetes bacterium CA13]|uniref:Uncharacterized protein n=1 Tax=Novipirellula herctigrandis TaxID=2527986 RepID=A0A5C5ZC80_9BACT|nr:hypothetical protein CA13_56490 [Planctomycetes bacterium CA13]